MSNIFQKGTLFVKHFEEAVLMSAKHTDVFNKFSATFPPEIIEKWVKMVEKWESNPKAKNPYDEPEKSKPFIRKFGLINMI
jgi:hypothetical protein